MYFNVTMPHHEKPESKYIYEKKFYSKLYETDYWGLENNMNSQMVQINNKNFMNKFTYTFIWCLNLNTDLKIHPF